jgi:hypothetical protein
MEIIYRAFDGKEFDDEEECLDYELKVKTENFTKSNHLAFFDKNGDRLNTSIFKALVEAEFISIVTKNAFEIVEKVGKDYGLAFPPKCGFWTWDSSKEDWVDIDDKIEELTKTLHFYHLLRLKTPIKEEE